MLCYFIMSFLIQTNLVNRITNLPSFFMHLTRICDYPYQNKYPQVYSPTRLLSAYLLPDTNGML